MNTPLLRPEPVAECGARSVDSSVPAEECARSLVGGDFLRVVDHYRTGVVILEEVHRLLGRPDRSAPFQTRREYGRKYRTAAMRLLAPVKGHRVALEDTETIGFLERLYPGLDSFDLAFVDVQELHGGWQRHQQGTHLAVLGRKLHPFYGTYAPTRTSHLELFATWLSQYDGARSRTMDVGTGCGVLAFLLAKGGCEHVMATDSNPNAIESVSQELARWVEPPNVSVECTDLLGKGSDALDLVVFNPPWLRGDQDDLLDRALHYQDGLFERFFDQAKDRLAVDGRVVMVFSNAIRLLQPDVPHPIEAELKRGRFRLVSKLQRKVKPSVGPDGRRRRTREKVEIWELALDAAISE